ncbi:cytochrome b/b6 domain-containing protein [Mangrovicoccus ximenensis]|uniref:cytochrome b/b6 domain-containing protein n=1 Tax=Mangrovicoccus ximenensis TaxID=1911570 RepID=UPI000D37F1B7|nr:hypothetical protein [Mangrovicoccus ximenensis]
MAVTDTSGGRSGARDVRVWDPLVRAVHWSVALIVLANGYLDDPETDLHHWLGYAAAGLVALRLAWGLVGSRHARLSAFPPRRSETTGIRGLRQDPGAIARGTIPRIASRSPPCPEAWRALARQVLHQSRRRPLGPERWRCNGRPCLRHDAMPDIFRLHGP